jgi:cell division protein FtsB
VAVFVSVLQIISTQKQPPLPPSYDAQLKALDQTRIKLQDLIAFIDSQKEQLAASQRAIETLKAEEGQLKPMVEADRKVIDAIFAAEARQYAKEKTRDAIYGFISGVAASLMAAFIWKLIAILAERRRRAEAAA